jgi:hypothetical protein
VSHQKENGLHIYHSKISRIGQSFGANPFKKFVLCGQGREDADPLISLWLLKPVITLPIRIVFYHQKFLHMYGVVKLTLIEFCAFSSNILSPQSTVKFVGQYWTHFALLFMVFYVYILVRGNFRNLP